jgi:hypothetical protein
MTAILEKAFNKASRLPDAVQRRLAEQMLDDITDELKWDRTLAGSQQFLEKLAGKARRAKKNKKTVRKGFDEL